MSSTWRSRESITRTPKTKSPQTNGIVERFHKTGLDEFYRVAFRKKIYGSIGELQSDLDDWVKNYNEERPHQGRWCFGKTPMQTFLDATPLARRKSSPPQQNQGGGPDQTPDAIRQTKYQLLHFDNRRQVAAYAGLAPTPWQSGSVNREQGISQSGNPRLRTTMIQLAWPGYTVSALHTHLWFQDRNERNGGPAYPR